MRKHVHKSSGYVPTMYVVPKSPLKIVTCVKKNGIRSFVDQLMSGRVNPGESTNAFGFVALIASPWTRTGL